MATLLRYAAKEAIASPTYGAKMLARLLRRHAAALGIAECRSILALLAPYDDRPDWRETVSRVRERLAELEPSP